MLVISKGMATMLLLAAILQYRKQTSLCMY